MIPHTLGAPAKVVARFFALKSIFGHKVDAALVRIFFRREVGAALLAHVDDFFGRELAPRLLRRLEKRILTLVL